MISHEEYVDSLVKIIGREDCIVKLHKADHCYTTQLRVPIISPYTWNPETQYIALDIVDDLDQSGDIFYSVVINDGEFTPIYNEAMYLRSDPARDAGKSVCRSVEMMSRHYPFFGKAIRNFEDGYIIRMYPILLLGRTKTVDESFDLLGEIIAFYMGVHMPSHMDLSLAIELAVRHGVPRENALKLYERLKKNYLASREIE